MALALGRNRPNPFNPVTVIPVDVPPGPESAVLSIHDALGRIVRSYTLSPGHTDVVWNAVDAEGRPVGSGVYVAVLAHAGRRLTMRMVVAR